MNKNIRRNFRTRRARAMYSFFNRRARLSKLHIVINSNLPELCDPLYIPRLREILPLPHPPPPRRRFKILFIDYEKKGQVISQLLSEPMRKITFGAFSAKAEGNIVLGIFLSARGEKKLKASFAVHDV